MTNIKKLIAVVGGIMKDLQNGLIPSVLHWRCNERIPDKRICETPEVVSG